MDILFEDKHILICEKPVGMSSEPNGSGNDIVTLASLYTGHTCFPIHRLDQTTGGAIVLAKTRDSSAKLSAMVQNRNVSKEYLAIVDGIPAEEHGTMQDLLFRDSHKNKSFVVTRMRTGVRNASLEYRLLSTTDTDSCGKISLVLIKLHTGRTHQIRVQFASREIPLLGDRKYGSRENRCTTALWSFRIHFKHPMTGEIINAVSFPKRTWPWTEFNADYPDI